MSNVPQHLASVAVFGLKYMYVDTQLYIHTHQKYAMSTIDIAEALSKATGLNKQDCMRVLGSLKKMLMEGSGTHVPHLVAERGCTDGMGGNMDGGMSGGGSNGDGWSDGGWTGGSWTGGDWSGGDMSSGGWSHGGQGGGNNYLGAGLVTRTKQGSTGKEAGGRNRGGAPQPRSRLCAVRLWTYREAIEDRGQGAG